MDEKEEKAVAAYQRGLRALESGDQSAEKVSGELFTVSPSELSDIGEARLKRQNLAISYVNESRDLAALTTLHRFLTLLHPAHAGAAPSRSEMQESSNPWAMHHALRDSLLALAREQYSREGKVDPDVQVALATVYYMMGEYDEARDCWVNAVVERPDVSPAEACCLCCADRIGLPAVEQARSDTRERWQSRRSGRRVPPCVGAQANIHPRNLQSWRCLCVRLPPRSDSLKLTRIVGMNIGVHREAAEHCKFCPRSLTQYNT